MHLNLLDGIPQVTGGHGTEQVRVDVSLQQIFSAVYYNISKVIPIL